MEKIPESTPEKELPPVKAPLNEHAEYFDSHPEDIRPEYLNNFYTKAPGSGFLEQYKSFPKALDTLYPNENPHMTDLRRGKTGREMFALFDEALGSLPETKQQWEDLIARKDAAQKELESIASQLKEEKDPAERMQLQHRQHELRASIPTHLQFNEALLPLYGVLRAKGYSHYDLVN